MIWHKRRKNLLRKLSRAREKLYIVKKTAEEIEILNAVKTINNYRKISLNKAIDEYREITVFYVSYIAKCDACGKTFPSYIEATLASKLDDDFTIYQFENNRFLVYENEPPDQNIHHCFSCRFDAIPF